LGGILNLTSYLPSVGYAKYVLVYLNKATNVLSIAQGTDVVDSPVVTASKPAVPTNAVPSAYIRLYGGQTAIAVTTGVVDARGLFDGGGAASATSSGLTVVHLETGESLEIPVTHQMVIHEDDLTLDGDITLDGELLFDNKNYVSVPASTNASGIRNEWATDDDYLYFCTETGNPSGTWKRTALSTW